MADWDGTVVLTTPRLLLRTFRREDLPLYAALNADPEVVRYLGGPLTREHSDSIAEWAQEWYATRRGPGLLAVERREDGAFLGMCGLHHQSPIRTTSRWRGAWPTTTGATGTPQRPPRAGWTTPSAPGPAASHLHHRPAQPPQPGGDAPPGHGVRPRGRGRGQGEVFQAVIYAITAAQWRSSAPCSD